jgi:hypothetical protein
MLRWSRSAFRECPVCNFSASLVLAVESKDVSNMATYTMTSQRSRHSTCNDHVVGAILSGWRYDISSVPPELRRDYEDHLQTCEHCHNRQRLHRTVDLLLFAATTLSFAAFLLASVVLHKLHALSHMNGVHLHLHPEADLVHSHIPASITLSLQAVALLGVFVSMVLWVLVAVATPVTGMVSEMRERIVPGTRDRLGKQAA